VSKGPYKASPDAAVATPTFLPSRVCVNWAPGVDFPAVQKWWEELMTRPCLRTDGTAPLAHKLTGVTYEPRDPMLAGVRVIKVRESCDRLCHESGCLRNADSLRRPPCSRSSAT